MPVPASVSDYRLLAEQRLPRAFFDYIDGGAYNELTLAANRDDLDALNLHQRVLRGAANIDTSTTVLGETLAQPVILGPVGLAGLYARRGEVQAARAAKAAGVPFCLSTVSICSIEEVSAAGTAPFWFQLYVIRDRGYAKELLARAQAAGCTTLVFTVDLPVFATRYRDVRNGMTGGATLAGRLAKLWDIVRHTDWLLDVAVGGKPLTFGNLAQAVPSAKSLEAMKVWVDAQFDPAITWRDLGWLRENWSGNIVIKGVLDADDARAAADIGASAVVVSNHGGRQLDGAPSAISTLPRVVDAVGDRLEVLMDGGIRSGQDVAKALALGAKAILLGRPWAYGLAARGEQGVAEVLALLKRELEITMTLLGVERIEQIGAGALDR
ncbi:MAG: L-lactate dehydrogenase [Rhodocyclaceae bacterium]|nr:MAG: L-lactate dehydrogenase [Rhodocyclaceae bacterium]MBV6407103.1 L-lactate dehydrogenase [Rhodocyclaceae bacterium]CAG0926596.1 L-lactate dehydrogenase (cytochrome) [Rhodocyclaceae bacterium]